MVLAMAEKAARADALESEVADLKASNADADARIERLTQILKAFDRARFGRRSEKLGSANGDVERQAFVFEEIETGIAAIKARVSKGRAQADSKRAPRRRKGFAPHLERVEIVIEPEELAEHAGKQKVLIGEDVSERLDVVPVKFRVIVTRRPKYEFKNADGVIRRRPRPISSKEAFRGKRFWPRSPSPNMPTACRSTGRRRSTPATRSSSTAS